MKAVFLGRFQPFHKGHRKVVEEYREKFDDFCIVIGSSEKSRTEDNPLTAGERESLIRECHPEVEILGLEDRESDEEWLEELKQKTEGDLLITENDRVKQIVEGDGELELLEHELHQNDIYSGSEVRRRIKSDEEWRYLVPDCAKEKLEELVEKVKKSGIQYEYNPGWKRENASRGTAED